VAKWQKYTGSKEDLLALMSTKYFLTKPAQTTREKDSAGYYVSVGHMRDVFQKGKVTDYLICQPHPYEVLIKHWSETGLPVYWRDLKNHMRVGECNEENPPFAFPNKFQYSFTSFRGHNDEIFKQESESKN
jgi:hypothetical protein